MASQSVGIVSAQVQGGTLYVGGTTGNEKITLKPGNTTGGVQVLIANVLQGTFTGATTIVAYGQAGDDTIEIKTQSFSGTTYKITQLAILYGDAGKDVLDARLTGAGSILLGGAGIDTLYGGIFRDVLIGGGGAGADTLKGGNGDDILIGGTTVHDANLDALFALMAEWSRTDADYATRIGHLDGSLGGGLNGSYLLNAATVQDDEVLDHLYGQGNLDWFFLAVTDSLHDLQSGEVVTYD